MNAYDFRSSPITVTAYDWVPDFAQGFVRDLRLRWALREAGFAYTVEVLAQGEQTMAKNLARQPFGQVPVLTVGKRTMFESGACVWRIAEASESLLPQDEEQRDQCLSWVFGALDSMEEPINTLAMLRLFAEDKDAASRLQPQCEQQLANRLSRLSEVLGAQQYLVGNRFTVADLLMSFVLRNVEPTGDLEPFPSLKAYVARQSSRTAFRDALTEQITTFRNNAAKYEGVA